MNFMTQFEGYILTYPDICRNFPYLEFVFIELYVAHLFIINYALMKFQYFYTLKNIGDCVRSCKATELDHKRQFRKEMFFG